MELYKCSQYWTAKAEQYGQLNAETLNVGGTYGGIIDNNSTRNSECDGIAVLHAHRCTRLSCTINEADDFLLFFAYTADMFQGPATRCSFVVCCKKCGQNIPAPVETMPTSWIAAQCPLCGEVRR